MLKSLKNKLKQAKREASTLPRDINTIQRDYAELLAKAGNAAYLVHIHGKDLANINQRIENLNYEGAARQKLDKENAEVAAKTAEELATEENQPQSGAV